MMSDTNKLKLLIGKTVCFPLERCRIFHLWMPDVMHTPYMNGIIRDCYYHPGMRTNVFDMDPIVGSTSQVIRPWCLPCESVLPFIIPFTPYITVVDYEDLPDLVPGYSSD